MHARSMIAALVVSLGLVACAPVDSSPEASSSWVGTVATEGSVTTVVTQSGSVWGGTATLIEDLSIGVESGADEYMLGGVGSIHADADHIYIVQPNVPAVRLFDRSGVFVANLGGEGQGPGEYKLPVLAAGVSDGVAFVYDQMLDRMNVYGADRTSLGTWPLPKAGCCGIPMVISPEGKALVPVREWQLQRDDGGYTRYGAQVFGEAGPDGSILWAPDIEQERLLTATVGDLEEPVPFSPVPYWVLAPEGVVSGVSDQYHFALHRIDGSALVVQRYWDPVRVEPDESSWRARLFLAQRRRRDPEWSWSGDEIPTHKPAYDDLITAASGEFWVRRSGPSRRLESCVADSLDDLRGAYDNPCWRAARIIDVFGADGRYQGEVQLVDGIRVDPMGLFIRDNMVLAAVEDDAGTIMVKRYRLVPPGGQ